MITKWLIEEAFVVSRLEAPPEARVEWGIGVSTPGIPPIRYSIIVPVDKRDRFILAMAIAISPEHKNELEKLRPVERVRVMHSILYRALALCADCRIAVQPDIVNPYTIAINMEIYEEEIRKYDKPYFMRTLTRFLNTYLAIVSGFNEWFPIIPQSMKERDSRTFM